MNQKAFTPPFWRNTNICLHSAKRAGFTLLELIMVILIIAILATLAIPQYLKFKEKAIAVEAIKKLEVAIWKAKLVAIEKGDPYLVTIGDLEEVVPPQQSQYWGYQAGESSYNYFYFRADRNGGPYLIAHITLTWNYRNDTTTWSGSHPGTPGGPTEEYVSPPPD